MLLMYWGAEETGSSKGPRIDRSDDAARSFSGRERAVMPSARRRVRRNRRMVCIFDFWVVDMKGLSAVMGVRSCGFVDRLYRRLMLRKYTDNYRGPSGHEVRWVTPCRDSLESCTRFAKYMRFTSSRIVLTSPDHLMGQRGPSARYAGLLELGRSRLRGVGLSST